MPQISIWLAGCIFPDWPGSWPGSFQNKSNWFCFGTVCFFVGSMDLANPRAHTFTAELMDAAILYIIMHHIFLGIGALCGPCGNLCRRREKYIVLYCVLYFPKQLVQLRVLYISSKRVSGYPDPESVGRDCRLPECRLPDCRLPKQLAQLILNEIYTYIYIIYIYIYIFIYPARCSCCENSNVS